MSAVDRLAIALAMQKEYGLSVAPAYRGTKTPATGRGGYHLATADPAALLKLWGSDLGANYLVATDSIEFPQGLVVIDMDVPTESKPNRPDGHISWAQLIAGHENEIPPTLTLGTRSGGTQLWFAPVPGVHHARKLNFLPSLDIIAGAGYAMGPGSHYDGWKVDPRTGALVPDLPAGDWTIIGETRVLAELPAFLSDLLPKAGIADVALPGVGHKGSKAPARQRAVRVPPPPPTGPRKAVHSGYVRAAIEGDLADMRNAPEGQRTPTLFRIACNLGHIGAVRGIELDIYSLANELLELAVRSGLDEDDARRHIGNGIEAGLTSPRHWKWIP